MLQKVVLDCAAVKSYQLFGIKAKTRCLQRLCILYEKNKALPGRNDRFEVDPELRLNLMRAVRGMGHAIVGHYHSHPNGSARPSATDLSMAYEPELVWLITAVVSGQAVQSTAHLLSPGGTRFNDIGLDCLPNTATT